MCNTVTSEPKLITNSMESSFYQELVSSLLTCKRFYLLDTFKELSEKNIRGKVITSTYLNFTDVKSLRKLSSFNNIYTKIYVADSYKGFHTKGYIFEYEDTYKIIVGSSNITQSALKSNVEWNVRYVSKKSDTFVKEMITEFDFLWDITSEINEDFLKHYQEFLDEVSNFLKKEKKVFEHIIETKNVKKAKQVKAIFLSDGEISKDERIALMQLDKIINKD